MSNENRRGDGPKLTRTRKPETEGKSAHAIHPRDDKPRRAASKPAPKRGGGSGSGGNGGGGSKKMQGKPAPRRRSWSQRLWAWLISPRMLMRYASAFFTLVLLFMGMMAYFSIDLPDISGLKAPAKTPGIQVLDAKGGVIARYGDIYGDTLPYDAFPKSLVDAVVATEDRNFFDHWGIDPWGVLRAMVVNLQAGRMVQGGSTITQQLAKNVFLSADKTFKRKMQELILAFWLESRYTKQEIMAIYLNRVYLGAGNYGVDAASRYYFGHPAHAMSLQESALIAGLLKAPSKYNPAADNDRSRGRAKQVLLNMVDADLLSEDEAARAAQSMQFSSQSPNSSSVSSARYFADWVMDQLPEVIGTVQEDVIVHTTLDPVMQAKADAAVAQQFTPEIRAKEKASQMALVAMKPDGEVVAMLGGRDYDGSEFNRAIQGHRQPGSAFKLFVYIVAMEMGYQPDSMMEDRPIKIGKWNPKNYKGEYRGMVTLREAVAQSINTIAVQILQEAGAKRIIKAAQRLGVTSNLPANPSLALGSVEITPLELATAYGHLPAGGRAITAWGIKDVVRRKDNKKIYHAQKLDDGVVLADDVVAKMNTMLAGVIGYGTGRAADIGRPAAGKTGTTSDYKDAWFAGYTPELTTVVWVGNDDASPMNKVTGGGIPARIWKAFMSAALQDAPAQSLPTGYENNSFLPPWLGGAGNDVPKESALPSSTHEKPEPAAGAGGAELGQGFWNKLFDSEKIEYDYPAQGGH